MLFKDYSINSFLNELSSEKPSPGGGSTAALVSALAGALNGMVYSLTIDKKSFETLSDENKIKMKDLNNNCIKFIEESTNFMEKDRKDFLELMDCYKLPKNNEEEILFRKNKIKECTIKAMQTPLELAKECLDFYKNIEFSIRYGNKNLISDAGVAAILLNSAIESAIINVKVNLNYLREYDEFICLEEECKEILRKSLEKKKILLDKVEEIIYPKK